MKFLVDECLSPSLCRLAHRRGFAADAVAWVGKAGWSDRELIAFIEAKDYTLVTNNSLDFRRLYARMPLHAGLVCLNAPTNLVRRELRADLFRRVLNEIEENQDLANTLLEADAISATRIEIRRCQFP